MQNIGSYLALKHELANVGIPDTEQYQDAILILEQLVNTEPSNPLWNYLYAQSLHKLSKDLTKALHHYNSSLENGYNKFFKVQ